MTAESRTRHHEAALTALQWFKIPRTLDHIAAVYAEDASRQTGVQYRHNASVPELLQAMRYRDDSRSGGSGYSDPTGDAAVAGWNDEDGRTIGGKVGETLLKLTTVPEAIHEHAAELGDLCADLCGMDRRRTNLDVPDRQQHLASAEAWLYWMRPHLEPAIAAADPDQEAHAEFLLRFVADEAEWLQAKCEVIWRGHRGETAIVAEQKPIRPCENCGKWRTGNTAQTTTGLCNTCDRFQDNHGALPTEACYRWWEHSRGTPPRLVIEAKALGKTKRRKAIG